MMEVCERTGGQTSCLTSNTFDNYFPEMPDSESPRPNYREIARRAGCSISTVSYALRNSPRISSKTRERIAEVARELGYTGNPLVSALMNQVRKNRRVEYRGLLAALCQGAGNHPSKPIFPPGFYEGAVQAANLAGYDLELFSLDDPELPPAKLPRIFRARGIPGVLVAPLGKERTHLPAELFRGCAGATIGTYLQDPPLHRAAAYQYWAAWEAMDQARRLDYRRAGFVIQEGTHYGGRCQFAAGFHWWQMEQGINTPCEPLILSGLIPRERERFLRWVHKQKLDLVVSGSEGSPLLEWLREGKWDVPGELGFLSLTIFEDSAPMAGMQVHSKMIGTAAVDLILGQIGRNEVGIPETPKLVLIKNQWQDGPTIRKQTD